MLQRCFRKQQTLLPVFLLLILFSANKVHAQHSPSQEFKGKMGKTLAESTPYKIQYNPKASPDAPNVVWILIDDAGFGATSAFGGLVETPNIDKLADNGLRFTNFHTTAICSPTRAALLTGRNHHSVHMGMLTPAVRDFPGYDTHMPFEKATIAEILRENGYNTFALGKWHLDPVAENGQAGPFNRWPTGRGFDHYYGFLPGATDQWHPELWEDQTKLDIEPNTKHFNELLADKAIKYIANQKSADAEKPFFLYFATGATHAPHQVAKEWIDKYKGKFDMGWDKYREVVMERQKKMGIIPQNATLPLRNPGVKPWDSLSADQQKVYAHFMEVYAAFYSYTDYEIGRIIDYLDQIDQLQNTMIVVMLGDNGASKGGGQSGVMSPEINKLKGKEKIDALMKVYDDFGTDESNEDYPVGWSMACNTPFRYWKTDANSEGGTRNPMILYYPKLIKEKGIRNQYSHLIDVLPTTLEITKSKYPPVINGYKQDSLEGKSLVYAITQPNAPTKHTVQYYEIAGSRSIYKNGWKAETWHTHGQPFTSDVWELYHLDSDFNELHNLADKNPAKLKELENAFDVEAKKYNVYPLKDMTEANLAAGRSIYSHQQDVTLYPGVDNLVGVSTPVFNGKSFEVTVVTNVTATDNEGVLFAIGGDESGISLFIKDGKFQYAHKAKNKTNYLVADKQISTGIVNFKLVFTPDANTKDTDEEGGGGLTAGTESIYINDEKVGERKYTADEAAIVNNNLVDGTDVGRDLHFAVSDRYKSPFNFNGKIKMVKIHFNY